MCSVPRVSESQYGLPSAQDIWYIGMGEKSRRSGPRSRHPEAREAGSTPERHLGNQGRDLESGERIGNLCLVSGRPIYYHHRADQRVSLSQEAYLSECGFQMSNLGGFVRSEIPGHNRDSGTGPLAISEWRRVFKIPRAY